MLLWALLEPHKLSPELRNALVDTDNTLLVSAASAWEIASKWRLGKLQHARVVVENYAMALHRLVAAQATSDNLVLEHVAATITGWPRWRASSPSRRSRSWAGAG